MTKEKEVETVECGYCSADVPEDELTVCNDCATEICSHCETFSGLCEDCEAENNEDEDDDDE